MEILYGIAGILSLLLFVLSLSPKTVRFAVTFSFVVFALTGVFVLLFNVCGTNFIQGVQGVYFERLTLESLVYHRFNALAICWPFAWPLLASCAGLLASRLVTNRNNRLRHAAFFENRLKLKHTH
jgi:hypothetical protein